MVYYYPGASEIWPDWWEGPDWWEEPDWWEKPDKMETTV
jgi:hypothetical protein